MNPIKPDEVFEALIWTAVLILIVVAAVKTIKEIRTRKTKSKSHPFELSIELERTYDLQSLVNYICNLILIPYIPTEIRNVLRTVYQREYITIMSLLLYETFNEAGLGCKLFVSKDSLMRSQENYEYNKFGGHLLYFPTYDIIIDCKENFSCYLNISQYLFNRSNGMVDYIDVTDEIITTIDRPSRQYFRHFYFKQYVSVDYETAKQHIKIIVRKHKIAEKIKNIFYREGYSYNDNTVAETKANTRLLENIKAEYFNQKYYTNYKTD